MGSGRLSGCTGSSKLVLEQEVDTSQLRLNTKCHLRPISIGSISWICESTWWIGAQTIRARTFARMEEEEAERHFIGFDFSTQQARKCFTSSLNYIFISHHQCVWLTARIK